MQANTGLLTNPLTIEDMIAKFKTEFGGAISFLFDGSCIDSEPPLPPGTGR